MTIKRGRWAARIPGLRWGGQQEPKGPLVHSGFDVGGKDESAMLVSTRLPSGRILFTPIKRPTQEEAQAMLAGYRMTFPSPFTLGPRKIGKSPALAMPYGLNKSVDEPDAT